MTDRELIAAYVGEGSHEAFRGVVARHLDMVYGRALRATRNAAMAEDVTQAVFIVLTKRAAQLPHPELLSAWLLRVTDYCAADARRSAARRNRHEQEAAAMIQKHRTSTGDDAADALAPHLDAALGRLHPADRSAIVLRYFQEHSFAQVGASLGISEDAAKKRLARALEKLRKVFTRKGTTFSAALLTTAIARQAVAARPPAALAEKVCVAALSKTATAGTAALIAKGALNLMAWTTAKTFAVAAAALLLLSAGTYEAAHLLAVPIHRAPPALVPGGAPVATPVIAPIDNAPGLTVRDAQGRLLSNVDVVADGGAYKRDSHTDAHGHFSLDGIDLSSHHLLLDSTRSRRMGLVTLPPNATADTPVDAVCDCFAAHGSGSVVDSAGDPVQGVPTFVFIQTADGQIFHGNSGKTDASGYFEAALPAKTGLTAWVVLSNNPQDPAATPHVALSNTYLVEFPALLLRTGAGVAAAPVLQRVRYSGRIVDEQNQPIPNVELQLSFPYKHMSYDAGTVLTDADGRFSRLLPPDAERVEMRLTARDFIGFQFDRGETTASIDALKAGTAVIVMKRGLPISGIITDATTGKPVSNVLVLTGRLYGTNMYGEAIEDYTSPRTDLDGHFTATGISPGEQRLQIVADGYAPQVVTVHLSAQSAPLQIALQPGLTYSAQIVDLRGRPVAGTRVRVENWWPQGDGFDRIALPRLATTDTDGRFTLIDLPREGKVEILLSAKKFASMTATWRPDANTPTLTLLPPPVLTGVVLDAATNKPIPDFTAYPAWYLDNTPEVIEFNKPKKVDAESGRFSISIQNFISPIDKPTPMAVRIVADGYLPQFSPPVPFDGQAHPMTLRLHAASPVTGTLHDAANHPAANAKVFIAGAANYASIQGLTLNDIFAGTPKDITKADDDGAFTLPAAELPFKLVALHEMGYAMLDGSTLTPNQAITLTPWATVEGTFTDAGKPQNGIQLALVNPDVPNVRTGRVEFDLKATTDAQGHFRFEHVPAMNFQLMKCDGRSILQTATLHPEPGKTLTIDIPAK